MAHKLLVLLSERPIPARNLRQLLGDISPATLSRLTKSVGAKIVSFGQARASSYARPRDISGIGHQLPVYQVDKKGDVHFTGTLWSLYGGYWWAGEMWPSRYYPSIPWFIYDLKPDGFAGRAFARRFGPELGLSEHLTRWKEDDILIALSRRGEDIIGDVIVGEESLSRYMAAARLQPAFHTAADYPRLAEEAIAGDPAGSSAGGEQPKFTVLTERASFPGRVLVKFSPPLSTPSGQRWSDLLVCEDIALHIVAEMGIPAVASSIHHVGNRTFLEVERFDRVDVFGRNPVNSLTVVDAEFIGEGSNWTAASKKLFSAKIVSSNEAANISRLDLFGSLIANTDRHHGNISLIPENQQRTSFKCSPVYDMLPMNYRPRDGEELSAGSYHPPVIFELDDVYESAKKFWITAAKDTRISEPFRKLCTKNHDILEKMAEGVQIRSPFAVRH